MIQETLLALIPLLLLSLAATFSEASPGWLAFPLLAVGLTVGIRHHWPRWSLWWVGGALWAVSQEVLFRLHGSARPPVLSLIWELVLIVIVCAVGLALWRRGDGSTVPLTLLPCALENVRFVFFDDLPAWEYRAAFSLVALAVYAAVFVLSPRGRGWLLGVASLAYLLAAAVISWPIAGGLILYPAYLPVLLVLAFSPVMVGWWFEQIRTQPSRATWISLALAGGLMLACIFLPWRAGQSLWPGPRPVTAATEKRVPVIIDTDLSNDDYVALIYLLRQPELDIRAVTVVQGVAHVAPGVENVRRLLAWVGRADIPVAGGPELPLAEDYAFPEDWRLQVDWGFRLVLPSVPPMAEEISAADLIRQEIATSDQPLRLIALGPLTNIALALRSDPALAARIEQIVISGGAINVPGIVHDEYPRYANTVSEWNFFLDATAADEVFRSGVSLALVPLDVTDTQGSAPLLFSRPFIDQLAAEKSSDIHLMTQILRMSSLMDTSGREFFPFWDAPVAAIAIDPAICSDWRSLSLRVMLGAEAIAGQTVVDAAGPPNAQVCLAGDQAAFESAFLK